MTKNKRFHTPNFKAQVALELIRGLAMSEVCSRYEIHPTQARRWKEQVLQNLEGIFSDKRKNEVAEREETINELYKQIG